MTDADRLARVRARDKEADGVFWFGVTTTGVYCRPSCKSRSARPEHISFHASPEAARRAGFRACRRCNPDGLANEAIDLALVGKACRLALRADRLPSVRAFAALAGLGPTQFRLIFRRAQGVSPGAWLREQRLERARDALRRGAAIADAAAEAGYGASARLHERSPLSFGMTPARWRNGAPGEELRVAVDASTLGRVLVAATGQGVAAIMLGDDDDALRDALRRRFPQARFTEGDDEFARTVRAAVALVDDPARGATLPLDLRGTAFQLCVWTALRRTVPGETLSYADLARRVGAPEAVRAVAGACAANPVAVAVPCHRVLRSDGALSGYAWGTSRKRALLAAERPDRHQTCDATDGSCEEPSRLQV